jgi:tetratricopeptide (TPR) repeat protein
MILLLAAAIAGCAAPGRAIGRHGSEALAAKGVQPVAAASVFDERREEMQFQLAEARWRRNEVEACRATLEEIVAHNPSHRGAHLRLAELYLLRHQPCLALSLMQRFCRAHESDAAAHHLLGLAYDALGHANRALAAYDMAAELDPTDPILRTSLENAVAAGEIGESQLASTDASIAMAHEPGAEEATGLRVASGVSEEEEGRESVIGEATASDEAPDDEPSVPSDLPRHSPGSAGKEPLPWAYELEAGELQPK